MRVLPLLIIGWTLSTLGSLACAAGKNAQAPSDNAWIAQLKDPARRVQIQWDLRLEKDPRKVPELVKLLKSQDVDLRITTLQILSETPDPGVWKTIAPMLKDGDPLIREAAANALGCLGDRGALPFLVEAFSEGMDFGEGLSYWVMPSDISDNYRYACVGAINRLAKQDFKYTRAVNNFGRMYWAAQIDTWWKQQQAFYSPSFREQAKAWAGLKTQIEAILADLPKALVEENHGVGEFDAKTRDLKETVEAIVRAVESPSVQAGELKEHLAQISKALLGLDEIFVYTPELIYVQKGWSELKVNLETSRNKLQMFLD